MEKQKKKKKSFNKLPTKFFFKSWLMNTMISVMALKKFGLCNLPLSDWGLVACLKWKVFMLYYTCMFAHYSVFELTENIVS